MKAYRLMKQTENGYLLTGALRVSENGERKSELEIQPGKLYDNCECWFLKSEDDIFNLLADGKTLGVFEIDKTFPESDTAQQVTWAKKFAVS